MSNQTHPSAPKIQNQVFHLALGNTNVFAAPVTILPLQAELFMVDSFTFGPR